MHSPHAGTGTCPPTPDAGVGLSDVGASKTSCAGRMAGSIDDTCPPYRTVSLVATAAECFHPSICHEPPKPPLALRASAGVALIVPAHHVMNDAVVPIFNLQSALHFSDHPPAIAMPELYELRAIHAMGRGEFAKADADLALAIKLAPNPASPAKQRGILAASQSRWADARVYFTLMAEHDPKNPDAWLMCAQASLALGESATVRTQTDRALSLASADWKTRPDVARFLAKLGAPASR